MWYVYVLECANRSLYTGITNNLLRRIRAHKRGSACYTRCHPPTQILYSERLPDRSTALKREAQIKRFTRAQKLALIMSRNDG